MAIDFSYVSLDDFWRLELEEAQRRYSADPTEENRAELRRVLRLFADLVVRGQIPKPIRLGEGHTFPVTTFTNP